MFKIQDMTKVVYKIPNLQNLKELQVEFRNLGILSYEWIEQPENITTCIAFGPLHKTTEITTILNKYDVKLY